MKKFLILAIIFSAFGCATKPEETSTTATQGDRKSATGAPNTESQSPQAGGTGGSASGNDVQVLTGGSAGAASPVVGGDNLGSGSGGGVGQAAKDAARNAATKQQTPPPTEDSSN